MLLLLLCNMGMASPRRFPGTVSRKSHITFCDRMGPQHILPLHPNKLRTREHWLHWTFLHYFVFQICSLLFSFFSFAFSWVYFSSSVFFCLPWAERPWFPFSAFAFLFW